MKLNLLRHAFFFMAAWHISFISAKGATYQSADAAQIEYTLSMNEPHTHYFNIVLTIRNLKKDFMDVTMPVWTPGSYKIREFARQVEDFHAENKNGTVLKFKKTEKNIWRVYSQNSELITLTYSVYAFELSVRTCFLDAAHGYVNGAGVFMFVDGGMQLPHKLTINLYKNWQTISTGLPPVEGKPNVFLAKNYDLLVDSPIEMGNQKVFTFDVKHIPHEVALFGFGNYNEQTLVQHIKIIVEEAAKVVDTIPYEKYLFILHVLPGIGGALEHLNSTTIDADSWLFTDHERYADFLSVVAHEYFHLWNVKRIRPKELGPFNYSRENYTSLLWVAEGFTEYYGNLITHRSKLISTESYLKGFESAIQKIQATPGRFVQSMENASRDAWIKFYMPDENSSNSAISYYVKGSVIGLLMDIEIIRSTGGKKNLDNVMRYLWNEYYLKEKRGYTADEFKRACEIVAGKTLDDFFARYIAGTSEINYNDFLNAVGLNLKEEKSDKPYLGIDTVSGTDNVIVRTVRKGSPAFVSGLNVNDEIVAINGFRVNSKTYANRLADKPLGEKLEFLISRREQMMEIEVTLAPAPPKYRIEKLAGPTESQKVLFEKWTGEKL